MKIRIGEVFRVEWPGKRSKNDQCGRFPSYYELTRGAHSVGADINKGIWAYKEVHEPRMQYKRRPAILLHSNPFKENSLDVPWIDVVDPENGYAIYNGDNRKPASPLIARGNALLVSLSHFYNTPSLRIYAPPILLFTQHVIDGNRKGYRQFSGYGVPTRYILQSQSAKTMNIQFTNLVLEIALFNLDRENNTFDWKWIDTRRDGTKTAQVALRASPSAWQLWVAQGDEVIERCRRKVARNRVISIRDQLPESPDDSELLERIVASFRPNRYAFEGLAALVAQRVIGGKCVRGWVTKRSGDGGIDFVCRLDVGSEFSRSSMVVLGQAKCTGIRTAVSSRDLTRVVARLQRGWLGVYVTTGVFSESSQEELYSDKYPVALINGKRLAREIRLIMNTENINLEDLLARERKWYEENMELVDASRIIDQTMFGTGFSSAPEKHGV